MELLSPAGNIEKLAFAYEYGADAAYIGLKRFSLRVKADNFYDNEYERITELKSRYPGRKLYCALNITFHNADLDALAAETDYFRLYPFDAFIIQDIGVVPFIQKHFPRATLHLSTQANCVNREAVKLYRSLGFSRVVLGREASLAEIREIKDSVPEMELECFVHGAMCIAYSGRCLMSAYLNGRSANAGHCSHSCRWEYRVLEEKERPGEYFPVFEGENFTAVLSSKDLCMIDHLAELRAAGVDSLKIEGRMKSLYYVALITRAYRKAVDSLEGRVAQADAAPFIAELYNTAHREFCTGFYFNREEADKTTSGATESTCELAAVIGAPLPERESDSESECRADKTSAQASAGNSCVIECAQALFTRAEETEAARGRELSAMHPAVRAAALRLPAPQYVRRRDGFTFYPYTAMNKLDAGTPLEYVGPDVLAVPDTDYQLVDPETGLVRDWISHGHPCLLYTDKPLKAGYMARFRVQSGMEKE